VRLAAVPVARRVSAAEQSGPVSGVGTPPSGTQRPQLTSQYVANQSSVHDVVSLDHSAHVAPGQSGSGGGSTSTQGGGSAGVILALVAGETSGTQRPQLTSQYLANHSAVHSVVSLAQVVHVASGQSGSGGGSTSTHGGGTGTVLLALPTGVLLPLELAAGLPVLVGPGLTEELLGLTLTLLVVGRGGAVPVGVALRAVGPLVPGGALGLVVLAPDPRLAVDAPGS
jgi:hypothetical protein